MFQVYFWCVDPPVLIPEVKWSYCPDIFLHYVCEEVWYVLNFHVVLKTLFIGMRALFRVLCLGVSISLFGLCVKLTETVLQLVVLVGVVVLDPGCGWLVQSIIFVAKFLHVWRIFEHFYWLYGAVYFGWYNLSYWSLWLSLVLLFCRNPWYFGTFLLQLAFVVVLFTTCTVFFAISGISLMYAAMYSEMVVIMTATAIDVMCGALFSGFSWTSMPFQSPCSCVSAMSHPSSGILLAGTAFLPSLTFPTCSSSYSLQTFSVIGIFLKSLRCTLVIWPWLSLISTWFLPKSPTIQKSLYLGWNVFDVWSQTSTLLPIFSSSGSFDCLPFLFPSLAFLASFRVMCFVISSMLIMQSSVPKYFGFSDSSKVFFTAASCLNMRKNGATPDDSVGKKLYAAVDFHSRSSHSTWVSSCFAIVALRNLWNPSMLPLHCGE